MGQDMFGLGSRTANGHAGFGILTPKGAGGGNKQSGTGLGNRTVEYPTILPASCEKFDAAGQVIRTLDKCGPNWGKEPDLPVYLL